MTPFNGVLPVDKPSGPTSHDIVAIARRSLGLRRIGHTGTLDPFASGLLLLCLGPSTRLAEYLTGLPKRYVATIRLGAATDTDDHQGTVIESSEEWQRIDREALESALGEQRGDILQTPSSFSAKKVAGERMYDVARRGGVVDLKPVAVRVERLDLLRYDPPDAEVAVDCSSGTYVRAIARDVGRSLGTGGHLVRLRREGIGSFDVGAALSLEELAEPAAVARALIQPGEAVGHLPRVVVSAEHVRSLGNGGAVPAPPGSEEGPLALVDAEGTLLALGERAGEMVRPRKVFL